MTQEADQRICCSLKSPKPPQPHSTETLSGIGWGGSVIRVGSESAESARRGNVSNDPEADQPCDAQFGSKSKAQCFQSCGGLGSECPHVNSRPFPSGSRASQRSMLLAVCLGGPVLPPLSSCGRRFWSWPLCMDPGGSVYPILVGQSSQFKSRRRRMKIRWFQDQTANSSSASLQLNIRTTHSVIVNKWLSPSVPHFLYLLNGNVVNPL